MILQGDHHQLPPVLQQGLADYAQKSGSLEVKEAWALYLAVPDCIILRETKRFEEPLIAELFDTIRMPRQAERKLRPELRTALMDRCVGADAWVGADGIDSRLASFAQAGAKFIAVEWAHVAREQHARTRADLARIGPEAVRRKVQRRFLGMFANFVSIPERY